MMQVIASEMPCASRVTKVAKHAIRMMPVIISCFEILPISENAEKHFAPSIELVSFGLFSKKPINSVRKTARNMGKTLASTHLAKEMSPRPELANSPAKIGPFSEPDGHAVPGTTAAIQAEIRNMDRSRVPFPNPQSSAQLRTIGTIIMTRTAMEGVSNESIVPITKNMAINFESVGLFKRLSNVYAMRLPRPVEERANPKKSAGIRVQNPALAYPENPTDSGTPARMLQAMKMNPVTENGMPNGFFIHPKTANMSAATETISKVLVFIPLIAPYSFPPLEILSRKRCVNSFSPTEVMTSAFHYFIRQLGSCVGI